MKLNYAFYTILFFSLIFFSCTKTADEDAFNSKLPDEVNRIWIGPEYWTNPMQDWKLEKGRMVCTVLGRNRNVHLLTRRIEANTGDFKMSIAAGILAKTNSDKDWVGFRLGAKGEFDDYRSDALFGQGLDIGVYASGKMFIGAFTDERQEYALDNRDVLSDFIIKITGIKQESDYVLKLEILNEDNELVSKTETTVPATKLIGGIAAVSNFDPGKPGDNPVILEESVWFKDWKLEGKDILVANNHAFGPILFAQHTLSEKILKMTAQLPPIGDADGQHVFLEIRVDDSWKNVASSSIDSDARTATFKVPEWDDSKNTEYRITYNYIGANNAELQDVFNGMIRKNPLEKEEFIIAGFTGNNDLGFPNSDLVANVFRQNPDLLFFSGDQIYETVGGYGNIHKPLSKAMVDYLRKWIMYGWEYRELLRNIPTVSIPDDHDVYHGNLWGEGGKKAKDTGNAKERQDSGGYKLPADFVKMVERTQTSNLPDPYDPTPVKQGIGVYYTEMNYGGISFAIIEDRKFKSSPTNMLPKESNTINGWAENKNFDVRNNSDVPGAVLLGQRQEDFLKDWGSTWSSDTYMKVLLSQTIFSNVATLPKDAVSDVVVPTLRILEKGDYPPDDVTVSDMDSNGWPQTPRDRAVDLLRRCFAFHLAGDQHLGTTIHYGIDDWKDAGVAACVPSVSNYWPRRWYPSTEGKNRAPGAPKYTGDYLDGFNNFLTVYAVSNPLYTGKEPSKLHDRAAGYGIIKMNKKTRDIIIELWPRDGDPTNPDSKPYDGWPVTVNQFDNYGRKAYGYMPKIIVKGLEQPPIVKIIDEAGEELYTVRAEANEFQPKVFDQGDYKVIVGEPSKNKIQILEDVYPTNEPQEAIEVVF